MDEGDVEHAIVPAQLPNAHRGLTRVVEDEKAAGSTEESIAETLLIEALGRRCTGYGRSNMAIILADLAAQFARAVVTSRKG